MAAGPTLTLNIKPMGRNKINIDWNKVDRMLEAGCDGTEVAATLGVHPDTLYRACERENKVGFADYSATKRASGDRLLRVKQFEIAMTGDKTMLVWLGKQRLGQAEKQDHTTGGEKINLVRVEIINSSAPITSEDDISEDI